MRAARPAVSAGCYGVQQTVIAPVGVAEPVGWPPAGEQDGVPVNELLSMSDDPMVPGRLVHAPEKSVTTPAWSWQVVSEKTSAVPVQAIGAALKPQGVQVRLSTVLV